MQISDERVRRCDAGERQSGAVVNDVLLPPWANGDARQFVRLHREALESAHVCLRCAALLLFAVSAAPVR